MHALSVVVPIYNEHNVVDLHREIVPWHWKDNSSIRNYFVDDGSTDQTAERRQKT
jgi:glycosyltransferase involved in cell wall biosynthesis